MLSSDWLMNEVHFDPPLKMNKLRTHTFGIAELRVGVDGVGGVDVD